MPWRKRDIGHAKGSKAVLPQGEEGKGSSLPSELNVIASQSVSFSGFAGAIPAHLDNRTEKDEKKTRKGSLFESYFGSGKQ